jgi:ubiquinone/menaquinone biosynthesis C-methylase UbiE
VKRLVRRGWDRASEAYRSDAAVRDVFGHSFQEHREWLRPIFDGIAPGARIADLGCGCGVPDSALLSYRYRVTGVDLSRAQVRRARRLVPSATFLRGDMTRIEFRDGVFAGAVCLYALIHVPLIEQPGFLERLHRWLEPGGLLVLVAGHEAYEGIEPDWLGSGAAMYWSHTDARTYRKWLDEAGFQILDQTFVPEGETGHELFHARAR